MNISRRQFLSSSAKSAVAVTLLHSFVPARALAQAAAVQPLFARLDNFITRHMHETGAPVMTLALANRDGLIRVSTYGYADTKAGLRVAPETMFEIGSISKSFVALALLQLRDEGKLDLDRPVVEYLPWLRIQSSFEPITVHHLLTHASGLPGAGDVGAGLSLKRRCQCGDRGDRDSGNQDYGECGREKSGIHDAISLRRRWPSVTTCCWATRTRRAPVRSVES